MPLTKQDIAWSGDFGCNYTERNPQTPDDMDALYKRTYGVTRTEMNIEFLSSLDRKIRILEVGSNVGTQLMLLWQMGFSNLWGIELQESAVTTARERRKDINFLPGTIFDLPFKEGFFDLVFTSGLLIHIHPDKLRDAMREVYRCSSKYIWGFEYFSPEPTEVKYRKINDLLWKRDFAKVYFDTFEDLLTTKEMNYPYARGKNVDSMFLLEKH